jgi:hypothetical protein
MEAEEVAEKEAESQATREGERWALDTGRLGQSFVILGGVLLAIHLLLTATSLSVPAESNWMIFNIWAMDRFITGVVVCCVLIGLGWMLCRRKGCSFAGDGEGKKPS